MLRKGSVEDISGTNKKGEGLRNLVLNKQIKSCNVGIYILNMYVAKSDTSSNFSGHLNSGALVFE